MYQQQTGILRTIGDVLRSLPVEALITTGRGISPNGVEGADNVEVRSFAEHDSLLLLFDLVVSHGGLGTASISAGAGIPVLCPPNGRDQNDNAAGVEALGLGRVLSSDAAPDTSAAAVAEMLLDRGLHDACGAFASRVDRFGDLARATDLVSAQAASG